MLMWLSSSGAKHTWSLTLQRFSNQRYHHSRMIWLQQCKKFHSGHTTQQSCRTQQSTGEFSKLIDLAIGFVNHCMYTVVLQLRRLHLDCFNHLWRFWNTPKKGGGELGIGCFLKYTKLWLLVYPASGLVSYFLASLSQCNWGLSAYAIQQFAFGSTICLDSLFMVYWLPFSVSFVWPSMPTRIL